MARRKRIPYDPPHKRRRRRSGSTFMRADQVFLSRRMLVVKGFAVAAFGMLAAKLGQMQIAQGEVFRAQAEDNVRHPETIPASRGLILDRQGRPVAENRRAWELRIIPRDLPKEDDPARRRVFDALTSALQLPEVLVINFNGVAEGSRETVLGRVASMLGQDEQQAAASISTWIQQEEINLLVKVTTLTTDDAARFRAARAELPGVLVINTLDYLVSNTYSSRIPIVIARDVPRDVALKLEANRFYLPGVELDDQALVRTYPGGDVMSHLLGYVGEVNDNELADPRHKTLGGYPIYEINDFIGKNGIEQVFEEQLRGRKGRRTVEVDAKGVEIRVLPGAQEPVSGQNIKLTIDLELQRSVGKALQEGIDAAAKGKREVNAERKRAGKAPWTVPNAGVAVAYDPRNGEVLAMVSHPYYDNQLFVEGISQRKWDEYNDPAKGKAFVNRAVGELYPPGSTFKLFLAASALDRGTLKVDQTYTCKGAMFVPYTWAENKGDVYACWVAWQEGTTHEVVDVYSALERSCDIFFYNVGTPYQKEDEAFDPVHYYDYNMKAKKIVSEEQRVFRGLGIDKMHDDMTKKFWFGAATGIDLPWEASGLFPSPTWKMETIGDGWSAGDTIITSIGQGEVQTTPLQMAMNTAALGNGGLLYKPRLVHEFVGADGKATATKPEKLRDLDIDGSFVEIVREGMRRVVHEETGTAFRNRDKSSKWALTNPKGEKEIRIAGKTGTAEIGVEDEDTGSKDTHAWFTCFAPLDKPEIAVSVIIENGGEGSTYAVPVADKVLRAYFELTGARKRGKVLSKTKL